jgi:hypothetical protein
MPSQGGQRTPNRIRQLGGSKEEVDELVNLLINLFEINAYEMQVTNAVSSAELGGGTRRRRRHFKKYRTRKH